MNVVGTGSSVQAAQTAALMQVLKTAQQAPAELVEKLLQVDLQNQASARKMEIAGQIIDAYA